MQRRLNICGNGLPPHGPTTPDHAAAEKVTVWADRMAALGRVAAVTAQATESDYSYGGRTTGMPGGPVDFSSTRYVAAVSMLEPRPIDEAV